MARGDRWKAAKRTASIAQRWTGGAGEPFTGDTFERLISAREGLGNTAGLVTTVIRQRNERRLEELGNR